MRSVDTNILLFALDEDCPSHAKAFEFVQDLSRADDVVISEFVLVELYRLLRNPVVFGHPLGAKEAVDIINAYRSHPHWRLLGFPETTSTKIHDALWRAAAQKNFAYRRIYDTRLALTLRDYGVTEFATANEKDFRDFGFTRVWNPLG